MIQIIGIRVGLMMNQRGGRMKSFGMVMGMVIMAVGEGGERGNTKPMRDEGKITRIDNCALRRGFLIIISFH